MNMIDGVLLVVDAADGPQAQTRFVLRKALEAGAKPIVVINKIDREFAAPHKVLDQVFDLFVSLHATDEQLDFPVIYASAKEGFRSAQLEHVTGTMEPLFDAIIILSCRLARTRGRGFQDAHREPGLLGIRRPAGRPGRQARDRAAHLGPAGEGDPQMNCRAAYFADGPAECFQCRGRGEMQIAILVEQMRREGHEVLVSRPEVIYRSGQGRQLAGAD